MKKILSMLWVLMLSMAGWAQNTGEYNPENPADPDVFYRLTLEASPLSGGTVSTYSGKSLSAGQSCSVSASPRLGYVFKHWMMGDEVVSNNSNFTFTMPEHDAVLTAYFEWSPDYNPENPSDPDAEGYSHKVRVYAVPSAGGYFNTSSFTLLEGSTTNIYAYPREGYRFESWMVNGEVVSTDNPLNIRMGTSDMSYTATFTYNPVSPGEPSPNVFNAATGEVVIDNFTPGSLNSALSATIGGSDNYALVQSITVIGRMQSSDFGFARNCHNCSVVDLSRTTGYTEVPSWSFEGAEALTKLVLPASVERFGTRAFYGCDNLSELYCYATTPPEVTENSFSGVEAALVVKVPASAVSLYQKADGWKDFTILPVDDETCSIIINLPSDASDGRYKNMYIELENAISGQTYRYLITDRTSYSFTNLIRNTSYNIRVKNATSAILGEKEKVMLGEEDLTMTFESLLQPQTLTAKVLTPDGLDITSQAIITWLNEDGSLLTNGAKAGGVLEGTNVTCRITLPQALAMQYKMPADVAWNVKPSDNKITCQLQTFEEVALSGRILDVTNEKAIANATITISQVLNGKYTKSAITRTDNDGNFVITVFNEQSSMTVSATNYLSQTSEYADFSSSQQLGDILLKAITGAVVTVSFTYTESVEDGQTVEEKSGYSDEANVTYSLYNQTQNKAIEEFNMQNGNIVLLEEVAEGDMINITAKSKTGMFRDVTATAIIDARNRASVIFPIVELGGLKAYYTESENNGVVGILYDAEGVLLRKSSFNGDTLMVSDIADGNYTLVTMGSSNFFNSVLNLSELTRVGLAEGRDFVKNTVIVSSGHITKLNVGSVPKFEEKSFYYTGEGTSFSANKSQVTIGNYITLRAKVDFKDEYATSIRNLKLIVDLPESCTFVDNSILTSNGLAGYEYAGNRVTINMNQQNDLVRFCVIPTAGGTCNPNAFVQFNYGGKTVMQPIGSAYFNAQNLAISVPAQTADSVIVVNGTAQADCIVKVYDDDVLLGQTRSLANGHWSEKVNLYKPYSHSFHNIHAEVETVNGQVLLTDTRLVEFDKTMTQLQTITMLYNGNTIVFDQIAGTVSTNTYSYAPSVTDFTFLAQFNKNDTALIKNLEFHILTSNGSERVTRGAYSEKHKAWVGKLSFGDSGKLPVNVTVKYVGINDDANTRDQIDAEAALLKDWYSAIEQNLQNNGEFSFISSDAGKVDFAYSDADNDAPVLCTVEELNYNETLLMMDKVQFEFIATENGYFCRYIDVNDNGIIITILDSENEVAVKLTAKGQRMLFSPAKAAKNTILRNVVADLKRQWHNGDLFNDIKGIGDNILSILGLDKYVGVKSHFDMLCDLIVNYQDNYLELSSGITSRLISKCPDGSLRLSREQIIAFDQKRKDINDMTSDFADVYYDYLKLYQTKLRNSVICSALGEIATLGLGKCVGKIGGSLLGKTQSFITYKLGARLNYTPKLWLKNILGLGFGTLEGNVTDILNPFKEGGFSDFESVGRELDTWSATQNKNYMKMYELLIRQIESSYKKCEKEDPEDDDKEEDTDKNKDDKYRTNSIKPSIDPSGYVYEGVSSNRLQGVTATAYYKETTEDMYGVLHEEARVWDASEYAQENPLFTDENGMYQWDVPQGMWQVKFEKEGYETTYSEWLPVPPPQLEVNIAMTQARQPEVKRAHAYEDGVEVEFDKYMLPSLLTADNILVSQNGQYVEGEVKMLNEETAYRDDNVKYASRVRFVPKTPFTAKEVTLTVANRVKSYAGIQMQDTYQQTFDIEKELKEIKVESELNVTTSKGHTLLVEVLPAATSSGKTLNVKSSSDMIVTTDAKSYTLDNDGKASVVVKGELPGTAALTFSVEGYDLSATTTVSVNLPVNDFCAAPTASIASGSKVTPGTEIRLFCATDDAVIYYTLDGSCPCDDSAARKTYDGTPIIVNEPVTIKAMAVAEGIGESDVVEFTYSIKKESLKYYTYESLVQTLDERDGWTDVLKNTPNAVAVVESAQAEWASQQKNVLMTNADGSHTCADFLLTDLSRGFGSNASEAAKTGFFTPVSFKVTKGAYERQAYAGYNTLCLPFSFKASDLSSSAKVFTFNSYDADKTKVVFKAVSGTVAAGTPCIVKEKANVVWTLNLSGKTIEAAQPSEDNRMRGTYVTTDTWQGKGYSPRSSDGKFAPLTQYLHPFRACFSLQELNANARVSLRAVFLDEDGVTVIDEINAAGSAADAHKSIYTLSGQRVKEVKRSGLYIVNGEKQYIEVK